MKVLGIIPARYGSSRFPGKPLIDLKGKSMIQRVYEGVQQADFITEVVVATDDQRIFDHVQSFGGKVIMTNANHQSGTDRCGEVIESFPGFDVVINIQGDEPLVNPAQLATLISAFEDQKVTIATLGIKADLSDLDNPNRIKIVRNATQQALYFSRSCVPNHFHYKGDAFAFYPYLRHIGLYAFRSEILKELVTLTPTLLEQTESLEQLRWMYYGHAIHVMETDIETPNIDTPEDVEKVLKWLE